MRSIRSLSLKISISILTAVLIIFAAIFLYNYFISSSLLLKNVEDNVTSVAAGEALKIDKMLEASEKIPLNFAGVLSASDFNNEDLQQYLELILKNNPEVFGSCIAFEPFAFDSDSASYAPYMYRGRDGGLEFKYLHSRELPYHQQDWYKVPERTLKSYWTEPYFDDGGGEILMCTYSVPFYYSDGITLRGVLTIDLSLDWLHDFVEAIEVYKGGFAFLISAKGSIITDPTENSNTLQNIFQLAEDRNYQALKEAAADMVNGGSDFIPYETPLVDGKAWLYYSPLPTSGWSLSVIIPEKEFMNDLYKLNRDLLLIGLIGILLIMILVVLISNRITKPLTKLATAAEEIGKGLFDSKLPVTRSKDEIGHLNEAIRNMQAELKNYIRNLQETTAAKEKIESELQIARDIQQGIIPKIFPAFPERENLDLYAILEPARDVGGDLYDFFFIDDDHLCFTIGDVSGKGVPASLFMAITRTLLRARMSKEVKVNEVIEAMNNELCLENENAMFVTLFLGVLNVETGHVVYCNAGHNYPFIIKKDGAVAELKGTHGTPLGAMPDIIFGSSELQLDRGDTIMLYTDGVSEAIDLDEKQYTEKRIKDKLTEFNNASARTMIKNIIDDLDIFVGEADQFDDITMLVLNWHKDDADHG